MNEQERWIVYPLLLMLVLMQVKDKMFASFRAPRVTCQELIVEGPDRKRAAAVQLTTAGGMLTLYDTEGKISTRLSTGDRGEGSLALLHKEQLIVSTDALPDKEAGGILGGLMRVHAADGKVAAAMYANEKQAGTIATYLTGKPLAVIDSAQHGPEQNVVGGLIKVYDTHDQVAAAMYTAEDGSGMMATYAEGRPQVVCDTVNRAGRFSLLDRDGDAARSPKLVLAKETNNWGAAYVFGPDGMPHPLAHFTVQRVMPQGATPLPIDPNTPLPPQPPAPGQPQPAPADGQTPEQNPPADGAAPADPPVEAAPAATPAQPN